MRFQERRQIPGKNRAVESLLKALTYNMHPSQLPEPPREKTRDGWIPAVASTVDTGGTSKIDSAGDELFFQGIETQ